MLQLIVNWLWNKRLPLGNQNEVKHLGTRVQRSNCLAAASHSSEHCRHFCDADSALTYLLLTESAFQLPVGVCMSFKSEILLKYLSAKKTKMLSSDFRWWEYLNLACLPKSLFRNSYLLVLLKQNHAEVVRFLFFRALFCIVMKSMLVAWSLQLLSYSFMAKPQNCFFQR